MAGPTARRPSQRPKKTTAAETAFESVLADVFGLFVGVVFLIRGHSETQLFARLL